MDIFPYLLMRIGGIPFEKLDSLAMDKELFERVYRGDTAVELEELFHESLTRIRQRLKTLCREAALQNGLVLSAPLLLDRIASYQKREVSTFRKKEKQTERTILQYWSRIAAKSSPFSTFSQIGVAKISEQNTWIENTDFIEKSSFISINNYLLKYFKDSIIRDEILRQHLPILVNATLMATDGVLEFLVNHNNIEAFQTVEANPVVQLILEILFANHSIMVGELVEQLQAGVDATAEELSNFIFELYTIGLLELDFGISSLETNWELKCLVLLSELPTSDTSLRWKALLKMLVKAKSDYANARAEERRGILEKLFQQFEEGFSQIRQASNRGGHSYFKKELGEPFQFSALNLFYEDYAVKSAMTVSKSHMKVLTEHLNMVFKILEPFNSNAEMQQMEHFYGLHFDQTRVGLLEFYVSFMQWKLSNDFQEKDKNDAEAAIQKNWQKALQTIIEKRDKDEVHLSLKKLKQLNFNTKKRKKNTSHSAFVQVYVEKKEVKYFLNSAMPGYGKYFSRFLHLLDNEITETLQARNGKDTERLLAEINDNSFFNVNIHPPLMPYEIKLLDGNKQLSENQQIQLKDIVVQSKEGRLQLLHAPTQKEIIPFDLGFQSLNGRSEMFKWLNSFSEAAYSPIYWMINPINDLYANDKPIQIFPRITIEEQIVIQRKTWIIHKGIIPMPQQQHETEWAFYRRVIRWQKENGLPLVGFYTVQPKAFAKDKSAIRDTDAHKPQYLDFKNPILVQLFIRTCKKIETNLKLEEMLPASSNLLEYSGDKYVTECLVEWQDGVV
jgi:lantibiotic biosynthesis protein